MRYLRYKKFMCAFIASAMVVSGLPGTSYSALAEENDTESSETTESDNEKVSGNDADDDEESSAEESLIASIDFDEENLDAEGAKAEAVGSVSYTDDTENGEGHALYLGGSSYLNLTDEDGNSLLSGHDELTISYRSKTEKSSYSWGYFAANDATARAESNLHYIGVLDSTTSVTAERFGSSRTTSLTASTIDEWKNVTVVYEDDTTTLYINGKKKDSATGCISLSEVLGDSSIFQIGKANWGSGEYFKGSIDDIKIYSKALDAETIAKKDILEKDESELVECSANDVTAKGARAGLKITEVSDLDTSDIYIESSESAEELPSKVEVTLSDGTKRDAYVSWTDSDSLEHLTTVSGLSAGKHELTGRLSYYPSPLVSEKADPFIIYNDEDGYYYMTSSWPAYGSINAGYDRIALRRAKTLIGLQDAEDVVIWEANDSGALSKHIWAPELHKVGDKWVVYFAGTCDDGNWSIGCHCLVNETGDLLDSSKWELANGDGLMLDKDGSNEIFNGTFSLDMTYFENEDVSGNTIGYLVWAYKPSTSNLMIAEVDMDKPWQLKSKAVTISTPKYSWEQTTNKVNEGPAVLKNGDNIYIAYSADGTGDEYKVGLLTADNDSDLLNPDSWTKDDEPVLSSDDLSNLDEYGPGHNSFTVDEDGNVVIVYHARDERCHENKCDYSNVDSLYDPCRNAEINYVSFDDDGKPVLNETAANQAEDLNLNYTLNVYVGTDADFANADADALEIPNADDIRGNITLPERGENGSTITWTSDNEDVVSSVSVDGKAAGVVTRQAEDTEVTVTASIKYGSSSVTKPIKLTVKAKAEEVNPEDYIFVHFVGETNPTSDTDEQIYFSSSKDGKNFTLLNNGSPVLTSTLGEKGLRDPSIIRSPEGDKFYLLATDLSIYTREQTDSTPWPESGVNGSHSIMVYESTDLVNWSDERMVEVAADNAGMAWAPEAVYDEEKGEYFVFWSSTNSSDNYDKHRVYYATTRDFYTFSEPQIWIENDFKTIDTSVIKVGDYYYRISKNESTGREFMERSKELLGDWEAVSSDYLDSVEGVEGGMIYKVNADDAEDENVDEYCMILDRFASSKGYFPSITTDIASGEFTAVDSSEYSYPSKMRHGSVLPITAEEYEAIQEKWPSDSTDEDDEVSERSLADSALFNLSFDGDDPFAADGVSVNAYNDPETAENSELGGKALKLSASKSQYLDISAEDGSALLAGQSEVTINYWSKIDSSNEGGWAVFAAPYSDSIVWGSSSTKFGSNFETYLGVIDTKSGSSFTDDGLFVQRFKDSGSRSSVNSLTGGKYDGSWKMVTVVAKSDSTTLYVNGSKVSTVASSIALEDLFGDSENGILRIGRASWGSGEYFTGLIDDITIYDRGITAEEVENIYNTKNYTGLPEEITHADFDGELPEGAELILTKLSSYSGDAEYTEGHSGESGDKAVVLGDYGVKLANENVGDKYSLSFWVKPTGSVVDNSATVFLGYHSPEKWLALSGSDSTSYKFWTREPANSAYNGWITLGSVDHDQDEWKMITITQDGNDTKLYVNGELSISGSACEALNGENQGIYLGVTYWDSVFNGYIDDLYLYDEVLNASQVYSLYGGKSSEEILEEKGISVTETLSLKEGKSASVGLSVPSTVKGYSVSYSSSDESVATVANGVVTAVAAGSAKITTTVTLGDVEKTATTEVTVTDSGIVNRETAVDLDFTDINGTSIADKSGNGNSAVIKGSGVTAKNGVLNLTSTGYVTLPTSIMDALTDEEKFTIECTFSRSSSCGSNAWVYCIGSNPLSSGTNYLFLSPAFGGSTLRSGIKNSSTELLYDTGITTTAGKEYTADMVFDEGKVTLYLNGVQVGSTLDSGYSIAEIIENGCKNDILGYLGKSCWSADPNFTGTVSKFAVYNGAKSAEEIQEPYAESFQKEFESLLTLDDVLGRNASADEVYFDLNFEDEVDEMTVSWKSSDESVIAADGTVSNITDEDKEVTVTASVTEGNLTASQTFDFTVKALDKTELNELLSEAADLLDIAVKLNDSLTALKEAVETAEAASTRSEIAAQVKSLSAAIAAAEADADYLDPFAKVDDSAYSESLELKVGESAEIINISDDVADYLTLDLVSADEEIAKLTESNGKVSVEALKTGTTELIVTVTSVYDAYPVQYLTEIKVTDESGDESSDNGNTGTDESDGNSDNGNSGTDESSESSDNGSSGTDESNEGGSDNGNAGADESDGNGSNETGSSTTVTPATPAGNILSDSAVNVLLPKTKYYIRPGFKVKKYVISNKKTVKVSKKGKVTIKKSGTATITAVGNNGQSVVYTIDAEIPKMKALTVTKAGNYNISEMLSGLTYAKVDSYASSKTSVAEISDNGTITVKAKGSTRITVVIDGKKYRAILKAKI